MSCASEQPRNKENRIPHLDYELLNDSSGLLEQPHHRAFHREQQNNLYDFIKSLRDDPSAYNITAYMVKFGVDNPDQLATTLVMDKDKVIATRRRVMRRAVKWQRSRKRVDEKYQVQGDE